MSTTRALVWLFIDDIFHQILFYFGGVASVGILIYEKKQSKPVHWRCVSSFFLFCLFISCFQAWVGEHRNSTQLIQEKSDIGGQLAFWRGQSFAKDEAIRSRDQLIFQGLQTLSGTQATENKTQQSLADLSGKIFDLTKPEALRIVTHAMRVTAPPGKPVSTPTAAIVIAQTNRRIGALSVFVRCATAFAVDQSALMQGIMRITNFLVKQKSNSILEEVLGM